MDENSAAATIWWTFWNDYLWQTFEPWWKAAKVPVGKDALDLTVGAGLPSLDEDLEAWTLGDQSDPAFAGPSGHRPATAPAAMVAAFDRAVSHLTGLYGGSPSSWTWGRMHTRSFPSVTGAGGLGYGPRAAGGDPFTEDAADCGLDATTGPSWRMVVSLGAGGVTAEGVYPGGQSENGVAVVRQPGPAVVGRPVPAGSRPR
jgi:penicillin amidase